MQQPLGRREVGESAGDRRVREEEREALPQNPGHPKMDRTRQATAGISMARITSQAVPFITTLTISIPMSRGPAPRQLPWVDWEEWDAVRRNLFSASGNDQVLHM